MYSLAVLKTCNFPPQRHIDAMMLPRAVRFTRCDFPLPIFLIIDSAHTQRELQLQLEFGVCLGGVFFFQTDKTVLTFQKRLVAFQFQLQLPFLAFRVLLFQCRLCVHCTAGNRCIAGLPTLRGFCFFRSFVTAPTSAGRYSCCVSYRSSVLIFKLHPLHAAYCRATTRPHTHHYLRYSTQRAVTPAVDPRTRVPLCPCALLRIFVGCS